MSKHDIMTPKEEKLEAIRNYIFTELNLSPAEEDALLTMVKDLSKL